MEPQKLWIVNLTGEVEYLEVEPCSFNGDSSYFHCPDAGFVSKIGESFFETEAEALVQLVKEMEARRDKIQQTIQDARSRLQEIAS